MLIKGKSLSNESYRSNTGKLRWMLLPVEWCIELIKVFMKGAIKYADNNWMTSINGPKHEAFKAGCLDSAYRHISELRLGKIYDEDVLTVEMKRPTGENYTETDCLMFNAIKTLHAFHGAWNLCCYGFYQLKEMVIRP